VGLPTTGLAGGPCKSLAKQTAAAPYNDTAAIVLQIQRVYSAYNGMDMRRLLVIANTRSDFR